MIKNKNKIFFSIISLLTILSCGIVDNKSCQSFIKYSSEPINDLLKSPEIINSDDKGLLLKSESMTENSISASKFPEYLFSEAKGKCTDALTIFIYSKINKVIKEENNYIPEKIWYINENNEVWESSTFTKVQENPIPIGAVKNKFLVEGKPPYLEQAITILKFKYNKKIYYLKTTNIFRFIDR